MHTLLTTSSARVLLPVLWVALFQAPAWAQRGITDALTPPAVAIGSTSGSYVLSGFESVNHYSGKLQFALPLLGIGGRGEAGYTMTLPISRGWQVQAQLDGNGSPVSYFVVTDQTPGFNWWVDSAVPRFSPGKLVYRRSGSGLIQCQSGSGPTDTYWYQSTLTRLTFVAADGSETELVDKPSGGGIALHGACDGFESNPATTRPGPYVSRDGSAMTFYPTSPIIEDQDPATGRDQGTVSGTLYFRDGRKYTINSNGFVTAITDRNGNRVDLTYNSTSLQLESVEDALGRKVKVHHRYEQPNDVQIATIAWSRDSLEPPNPLSPPSLPFPDSPSTRTLEVRTERMNAALATGQTIQTPINLFGADGGSSQPFDPQVITSVKLPDGRSYSFKYNSYGELAEVRLPTGGAFRYEWAGGIVNDRGKRIVVRRVTRRDVISEGETIAGYSTYAYESSALTIDGRSYRQTKVTETPSGTGVSGSQSHFFYGDPQLLDNEQILDIPETYVRAGECRLREEVLETKIRLSVGQQGKNEAAG